MVTTLDGSGPVPRTLSGVVPGSADQYLFRHFSGTDSCCPTKIIISRDYYVDQSADPDSCRRRRVGNREVTDSGLIAFTSTDVGNGGLTLTRWKFLLGDWNGHCGERNGRASEVDVEE